MLDPGSQDWCVAQTYVWMKVSCLSRQNGILFVSSLARSFMVGWILELPWWLMPPTGNTCCIHLFLWCFMSKYRSFTQQNGMVRINRFQIFQYDPIFFNSLPSCLGYVLTLTSSVNVKKWIYVWCKWCKSMCHVRAKKVFVNVWVLGGWNSWNKCLGFVIML